MMAERFAMLFPLGFGDLADCFGPGRPATPSYQCRDEAGASWPCALTRWVAGLVLPASALGGTPCHR